MKKATKKLLISAVILVIAISLATTTTFAWFTMNNTPEVNGFNVEVTAVDGLYISTVLLVDTTSVVGADGTYKSYVTQEEILTAIKLHTDFTTTGIVGGDLKNLTAATTSDGTTFVDKAGNAMGDVEYTSEDTTNYTFRLYFRSNNAYTAKLDMTNSTVTSAHSANYLPVKAWKEINSTDYPNIALVSPIAIGENIDADAKDAVMVSFSNGTTTAVWDPNSTTGYTDNTDGNIANDYYDYIYGTTTAVGTIITANVDADEVLLTLTGAADTGYNGYLDISIWIEGWDANCFNTILDDTITTALKFVGTAN